MKRFSFALVAAVGRLASFIGRRRPRSHRWELGRAAAHTAAPTAFLPANRWIEARLPDLGVLPR